MQSLSHTPQIYSYSRFSRLKQRDGDSLKRQREYAEEVAKEYSMTINEDLVFSDHGKSAFHAEHKKKGKYGIFLDAVKQGKVAKGSVLIVESFDRLSRENAMRAQSDITALIESDITIITSSDKRVYNKEVVYRDPSQIFMMVAVMVRAHEESLTKQKRSLKRLKGAVEKWQGGDKAVSVGGANPSWVKRTKIGLVFDKEKADVAKKICDLFTSGKTMVYIAAFLNDSNIPTFGRASHWRVTTITTLLENEALFGRKTVDLGGSEDGVVLPFRAVLEGYFPALITKEEFDLIQEIKKLKAKGRAGHRTKRKVTDAIGNVIEEIEENAIYLLSGYGVALDEAAKSRCARCGGSMGTRRQHQYTRKGVYTKTEYRFECAESSTTGFKKCDVGSVRLGNMEASFLLTVSKHIDFNLLNKNVDSREVEVIDSKLKEIEVQLESATELLIATTNATIRQTAQKKLSELEAEQKELERKKLDGKEFVINQDAIDHFVSVVDRAAFNVADHEARSEVKNILMQSTTKLVMHIKKKQTMKDFGFSNIMPDVNVYAIEVHFKSGKVMWYFHDAKRDQLAFTVMLDSEEVAGSLSESYLKKWNELGDESYEEYLAFEDGEVFANLMEKLVESQQDDGSFAAYDEVFGSNDQKKTRAEEIQEKWDDWKFRVDLDANNREYDEFLSKNSSKVSSVSKSEFSSEVDLHCDTWGFPLGRE
ncbi:recombinase family protein [Vibrio parahaemolyticus]|uniref:recombinase family protein n=1 Tax=Vibrio parahaemolyticus TaxID=670 RepID=UPI00215C1E82|nr:recombinase family protein [Vibrio parahaemolyticus]MCR9880539.1 recombinase family protein [Vibrio parahaemolyticus]MCR9893766.1 recombinase family protein [Vibrio parahaemolyticus]MDF4999681.1 recombinase family protein [Vibrio parahaemolyticus]MDF5321215.1 recombinase family protein [Vibrio parahaemolyticus]